MELWPELVFEVGEAQTDSVSEAEINATPGRNYQVGIGSIVIGVIELTKADQSFEIWLKPSVSEVVTGTDQIRGGVDIGRLVEDQPLSFAFEAGAALGVDVNDRIDADHFSRAVLQVVAGGRGANCEVVAASISRRRHLGGCEACDHEESGEQDESEERPNA